MFLAHVKAHGIPAGVPVALSGEAFLSGGLHYWLGTWSVEHQPVTRDDGHPDVVTILLPLTDQQLAVIEPRRAGADLQIQPNVDVTLGYHPLGKAKQAGTSGPCGHSRKRSSSSASRGSGC
jgi:hypothetical protein